MGRSRRGGGGWIVRLPVLLFALLAALWVPVLGVPVTGGAVIGKPVSQERAVRAERAIRESPVQGAAAPVEKSRLLSSDSLRRDFVAAAQSLVGKVGYFWGGKSDCVGWDPRWGESMQVLAPGGPDSGAVLPFGLDCSGLVSWAAVTAAGTPGVYGEIGDGAAAQYAACTPVDWTEIQAGDLLFFPDRSHVGIAAGDAGEAVPVIHASHTLGGVVLSPDAAGIGFTLAGVPAVFRGRTPFVN